MNPGRSGRAARTRQALPRPVSFPRVLVPFSGRFMGGFLSSQHSPRSTWREQTGVPSVMGEGRAVIAEAGRGGGKEGSRQPPSLKRGFSTIPSSLPVLLPALYSQLIPRKTLHQNSIRHQGPSRQALARQILGTCLQPTTALATTPRFLLSAADTNDPCWLMTDQGPVASMDSSLFNLAGPAGGSRPASRDANSP